jgi:hypothetical protein
VTQSLSAELSWPSSLRKEKLLLTGVPLKGDITVLTTGVPLKGDITVLTTGAPWKMERRYYCSDNWSSLPYSQLEFLRKEILPY